MLKCSLLLISFSLYFMGLTYGSTICQSICNTSSKQVSAFAGFMFGNIFMHLYCARRQTRLWCKCVLLMELDTNYDEAQATADTLLV